MRQNLALPTDGGNLHNSIDFCHEDEAWFYVVWVEMESSCCSCSSGEGALKSLQEPAAD